MTEKVEHPHGLHRFPSGIAGLDRILSGGLFIGGHYLVMGPPGTGKTLLGSHFLLAGSARGELGLYFGFSETPSRLERKLARFGFDVTRARAEERLEVLWQSPVQPILDVPTERLLEAIKRRGVRQLFLDGLGGFLRAVTSAEQLYRLISILKMRESGYDPAIREFRITDQGIDVAPTFAGAQAILTGVALPTSREVRTVPFAVEAEDVQGGQL